MISALGGIAAAFVLSAAFCWAAYKLKFLSGGGAWAATALGALILGLCGWAWILPLLAFFISSSVLSQARKARTDASEEARGSRRDAVQVLANGGIAGLLVLIGALGGVDLFAIYAASLAAANADTWSTEIGLMFGRKPRSIATGKPVPPGTSGGVTAAGLLGAAAGAIFIARISSLAYHSELNPAALWIIVLAGIGGSLFDSLLGATLQARYVCPVCTKETEKTLHCERQAQFIKGWRWLNNDGVNSLCTAFGAVFAMLTI
jgi:uncharacterized protein (TIGR00297 family)